MKYDFETPVNRSNTGSEKWAAMYRSNPNVGKDVFPFSVADLDIKTAPEIVEGLQEYIETAVMGYDLPTEDYYRAIINWMGNRHAWEIKKEWIICTPGIIAAFYSAIRAYTDPGDGVLYMGPVYYPFMKSIKNTKRKLINNSLIRNGDRYEIDFEGLTEKAKEPNTKLMLFSNPHNPVGRVWTKAELERVVDICAANDVVILADEIHHDLIMPGHVFTPMAFISESAADICITATAASKSFNIAGLRNSNVIISNPELHTAFKMDMEMTGIGGGTNVIGLKATEIAYTAAEDWLEAFKALIWHNHETLKKFLAKELPEVTVFDLEGTYLQWMDFSAFGLSHKQLEEIMEQEAQVFLDEGYIFGDEGRGYERISLGAPTKTLMEAMERLVTVMKKYRTQNQ